jgi:4'-phosphopantetheinyl transferase
MGDLIGWVEVGLVSCAAPSDRITAALETLDPARRERLRRFRRAVDLERGVLADALAAVMAADALALPSTSVTVTRSRSGAPVVRLLDGSATPVHVSLTHAGDWVGCAISDAPVGLDVEVVTPRVASRIAGALPAWTVNELLALPEPDRSHHAVGLWTAIESYLKLLGTGLAIDPNDVRVLHAWGSRAVTSVPGRPPGYVRLQSMDEHHRLAVASLRRPRRPAGITMFDRDHLLDRYLAAVRNAGTRLEEVEPWYDPSRA